RGTRDPGAARQKMPLRRPAVSDRARLCRAARDSHNHPRSGHERLRNPPDHDGPQRRSWRCAAYGWRLFPMLISLEAFARDQCIAASDFQIAVDHFLDQGLKGDLWLPPELAARLARVSQQSVDLRRPKIPRIYFDDTSAALVI